MSGVRLAALYSIAPHKLGLCGPQKKSKTLKLFNYLSGKKISEKEIKKILQDFRGAYFYYKLIAKSNNIFDVFNEKIVRAYWIGNELLEKVGISKLKELIAKNFKKPKLAKKLPENSKSHHSFHVLIAGPMRKDLLMTEGMKDLCKISWGKVLKIGDGKLQIANLIVEYQPLLKEKNWFLGKPIKRRIFCFKRILPKVKVGDFISFHWDLALEKLSETDLRNLKKYTELSVQTANFCQNEKKELR